MGKRLGRKRLYSLEKKGQSNTNTPSNSMTGAIGHTKVSRDGNLITTEITIDLGSSRYPGGGLIQCAQANAIIGTGSLGSTLGRVTTAVNGIVTEAELICVESPVGGVTGSDIDVSYGTGSQGLYSASAGMTQLIDGAAATAIGKNYVVDVDNNVLAGKYLYLTNGFTTPTTPHNPTTDQGNATAFSAGKFILRLYGYAVPDDL